MRVRGLDRQSQDPHLFALDAALISPNSVYALKNGVYSIRQSLHDYPQLPCYLAYTWACQIKDSPRLKILLLLIALDEAVQKDRKTQSVHDRFIKPIIGNFVRDKFDLFLPESAPRDESYKRILEASREYTQGIHDKYLNLAMLTTSNVSQDIIDRQFQRECLKWRFRCCNVRCCARGVNPNALESLIRLIPIMDCEQSVHRFIQAILKSPAYELLKANGNYYLQFVRACRACENLSSLPDVILNMLDGIDSQLKIISTLLEKQEATEVILPHQLYKARTMVSLCREQFCQTLRCKTSLPDCSLGQVESARPFWPVLSYQGGKIEGLTQEQLLWMGGKRMYEQNDTKCAPEESRSTHGPHQRQKVPPNENIIGKQLQTDPALGATGQELRLAADEEPSPSASAESVASLSKVNLYEQVDISPNREAFAPNPHDGAETAGD